MNSVSHNYCLSIISVDEIVLCISARQVSNLLLLGLKMRDDNST